MRLALLLAARNRLLASEIFVSYVKAYLVFHPADRSSEAQHEDRLMALLTYAGSNPRGPILWG
jgi:hypothetical protein